MVIVAPDGKLQNQPLFQSPGSFFANTKAGRYEDMLMDDLVPFIEKNYSIAPGRENRIIGGVSMGGGSAARNRFEISPPVCHLPWDFPALEHSL